MPLKSIDAGTSEKIASAPWRSPLRYPGGKQKALAQIAAQLPSSCVEYREPMVGGGSVFLHARANGMAKRYWINDQFEELIAFWQTIQDADECRKLITELEQLRSSFKSAAQIKKYFLQARLEHTEEQFRQAMLFFFFNRVTFSGTTRAGGFSSSAAVRRFTESSIKRLTPLPAALHSVKISCVDFEELVAAPGKDVFIFLDPPYCTATRLYGKNGNLHTFDHERLSSALKRSPHRFLITYDDCDEIRRLYKWAPKIESWSLQYGMNNCNRERLSKVGCELFISNY
jgi:DNA adenine methylase